MATDPFAALLESLEAVTPTPASALPGEPAEEATSPVAEMGAYFQRVFTDMRSAFPGVADEDAYWSVIMHTCYDLESTGDLPKLPEETPASPELAQEYLVRAQAIDLPALVMAAAKAEFGSETPKAPEGV